MRYLWVDDGSNPDYPKGRKHEITGYYFALFDPRLTPSYLEGVYNQGYNVGVYMASNWPQFNSLTSGEIAKKVFNRVHDISLGSSTIISTLRVQFDIEEHDPDFISNTIMEWRRLQPYRSTSWTMEPFQGGWMTQEFVNRILQYRIRVVPQYYFGDMTPVAQDRAFLDLLKRGFLASIISGFYDAARLPAKWDGFAFTQNRLP